MEKGAQFVACFGGLTGLGAMAAAERCGREPRSAAYVGDLVKLGPQQSAALPWICFGVAFHGTAVGNAVHCRLHCRLRCWSCIAARLVVGRFHALQHGLLELAGHA